MISFKMRGRKAQNQKPKLTPQEQQAVFEFREGLKQLGAYTNALGRMGGDILVNGLVAKEDEWVNTLLRVDGIGGYYEGILERKDTPLAKLDRGDAKIVKEGGKYRLEDLDFTTDVEIAGYDDLTDEEWLELQEEAEDNWQTLSNLDQSMATGYHEGTEAWADLTGAQRSLYYEMYALSSPIYFRGDGLAPPPWKPPVRVDKTKTSMLRFIHG